MQDEHAEFKTIRERDLGQRENIMQTVYRNGDLTKEYNFEEVRLNTFS